MLVLFCVLPTAVSASDQSQVETIIQRSVEANNLDWKVAPEYGHFERDVQDPGTRTYQVMMIGGSPYQRLVAINEKPLTAEEQAEQEQKLQQVIAQRKRESPQQRAARIARYEKDRKRDHLLMDQLTKGFNFTLEGEQKLGPYEVYVLRAKPRPGYVPPNNEAKVLTGMEGTLWIDKSTFQWVKVEAQAVRPVSIEGFLARIEPGTRFELEKMPVSDGIWLPKHFAMKAHAKILFVFNHREEEDETYWGYQKQTPTAEAEQQSLSDHH